MADQPKLKGYVFTERLGSGTYSTVYKAFKNSIEKREVVAIKCIKKTSLNKSSVENLMKEIEILKKIQHEHIVSLLDFQWDTSHIYLILEFCGGGDLSKLIKSRKKLPEYFVKRFLQQLAAALKYLSENEIVHFDLKPHNILLTSDQHPILKLADFGFAEFINQDIQGSIRGSPLYMAPEIITSKHYNAKVDLWSIGVILFECLFGVAPYASSSVDRLLQKITQKYPIQIPSNPPISSECRDLLQRLLQHDPEDRISFENFFQHPFIDLQYRPSPLCIHKATELVKEAIQCEEEGLRERACYLYSQSIRYFVPAIYYETDVEIKKHLRCKVDEYCTRAEQLQMMTSSDSSERRRRSAAILSQDPKMKIGIDQIEKGQQLEMENRFEESLSMYEDGIETLLAFLPTSNNRKILSEFIDSYLQRAETLKTFLVAQKSTKYEQNKPVDQPATNQSSTSSLDDSYFNKCLIQ